MGSTPRIVVVGLGPGGDDDVTLDTLNTLERIQNRFLRTTVHPTAHLVDDATSFDHLYDSADTFEQVYDRIVAELVAAAHAHREIVYAVPGSPLVLERVVRLLRTRATTSSSTFDRRCPSSTWHMRDSASTPSKSDFD